MAGERLVEVMQRAASGQMDRQTPTDFTYGIVTGVNPLTIQADNKKVLTEDFLVLSALCRPFTTTAFAHLHKADAGAGEDTDTRLGMITIWRGLAVGDSVRMIRAQAGQKYYVLDREGLL